MTHHPTTRIAVLVALGVSGMLALWWALGYYWSGVRSDDTDNKTTITMQLTSPAFLQGGRIPAKYTCDGEQISPQLIFDEVPEAAKSLVVIMEDPDVPVSIREDGMWNHWLVWNIDPSVRVLSEGVEPEGIHGRTTSSTLDYYAPCPPDREHRYFFYLYALDSKLALPEGSTKEELLVAMKNHVIGKAELLGTYQRAVK